jgi:hypothetical protein
MIDEDEPTVVLLDGSIVLRAVYDLVGALLASGHAITIEGGGEAVRVEPRVPDDTLAILETCWHDVEATLDNDDGPHRTPIERLSIH